LDEIDAEILRILCKDARTSFKRVGQMLGIGTDTVFRRFDRLKKEGVILGSTVILSSRAIGIKGLCGLFIRLKPGSSISILKDRITEQSPQIAVFLEWGEYDFYVDVFFRDYPDLTELIDNLRKIKEIATIDLMIYTLQEWSIPWVGTFETGLPPWFCRSTSKP
jgi:Lrp/AsnC family transcriptional regulator for asnA, asnC and gidA